VKYVPEYTDQGGCMCNHWATTDLWCFNSDCGPDCHVCCLHTETRYIMTTNQSMKITSWAFWNVVICSQCLCFYLVVHLMRTVHLQVFRCSWVSLYKLVVLEYMTADMEFYSTLSVYLTNISLIDDYLAGLCCLLFNS